MQICPTPAKQEYRSQAAAKHAEIERRSRGNRNRLYPYECGGHWHLTHHSPETQRAVFNHDTGEAGLPAIAHAFQGTRVRHVIVEEPVFIGRDVCDAVGITKYRDALAQLDDDERVSVAVDTPGGVQRMTAVTEAGIYSLMLISRSDKVKPFKRWLTHEVLPQIRKTGRYEPGRASMALPDRKTLAQWVVDAETRAEVAEAERDELKPSAAAWNELAEAAGDYAVSDAAKVLSRDPNIDIRERKLFQFMCGIEWVFKRDGRWKAYRTQIDNGRLAEKVGRPFWHEGRGEMINGDATVRITPKGLAELHKRLGGSGQLALVAAS